MPKFSGLKDLAFYDGIIKYLVSNLFELVLDREQKT